ncbi:nuclear transport factor 2 family protein [Halorubrum sp. SD626R]|uniref:nuclear transport factor 2 family protein n=1 Tax=Halorubrum sp. SD626R TaxID=1419722 RepID=UPI000A80B021|nr:nuclear transport factor 2 family protein [Halorubrum sp. SD626R]TKX81600.1 nuclear transport factor 2 family protein [Halorubrum sp. SD626R]
MGNADPATVRSYYESIDAEAYESVFAIFDDDVVYERPGQGDIEGKDALREFYLDGRPLTEGLHEVHSMTAEGDTVAVRGTFSGLQDGDRVGFGFADFFVFTDAGTVGRRYTYTDRDEV